MKKIYIVFLVLVLRGILCGEGTGHTEMREVSRSQQEFYKNGDALKSIRAGDIRLAYINEELLDDLKNSGEIILDFYRLNGSRAIFRYKLSNKTKACEIMERIIEITKPSRHGLLYSISAECFLVGRLQTIFVVPSFFLIGASRNYTIDPGDILILNGW